MKKYDLVKYLGGNVIKAAEKLGYIHRNSIYQLPETLTDRQAKCVMMRMKAKRIKIPPEWLIDES
jgi:hypothetical protein